MKRTTEVEQADSSQSFVEHVSETDTDEAYVPEEASEKDSDVSEREPDKATRRSRRRSSRKFR